MKVALAGEALIDFTSVGDLRFQGYCGGSPLNTAIAVARLGQQCGYITQLSTDLFGERLRRHLEDNGVDTRFVLSHPAPTSLAFVDRDGEANRYQFLLQGTADSLYAPTPLPVLPAETAILLFGSVSLLVEPEATSVTSLAMNHRDRVTLIFDPNVRPSLILSPAAYRERCRSWIRASHIVKMSDDDLAYLSGAADVAATIDEWLEDGPVALIVTSGSDGARVFRRGEAPVHVPSFQVPIADTIGAGDTFSAATIVALLERGSATPQAVGSLSTPEWTDVLRFAAAAAALNCTRPGADPPTRRELRDFLDSARVPNHAQLASDDLPVRQGRHQRRK